MTLPVMTAEISRARSPSKRWAPVLHISWKTKLTRSGERRAGGLPWSGAPRRPCCNTPGSALSRARRSAIAAQSSGAKHRAQERGHRQNIKHGSTLKTSCVQPGEVMHCPWLIVQQRTKNQDFRKIVFLHYWINKQNTWNTTGEKKETKRKTAESLVPVISNQ